MNGTLRLNAEFQKNIWEEMTVGRLVFMPVAVGLIAAITIRFSGAEIMPGAMGVVILLLTVLWGSRMASDSVTEEVANRTWDVHRLSAQSATGLVLGKFAGGTIYSWYGAAIATGIAYYFDHGSLPQSGGLCLAGVVAQSAAFFAALALRGGNTSRRVQNLIGQLVGLVAGFGLRNLPSLLTVAGADLTWYGHLYQTRDFVNALSGVVVAWFLSGGIRLVRRDMGLRDGPFGWIVFTIAVAAFAYGFAPRFAAAFAGLSLPRDPTETRKLLYVAVAGTYVALLGNPGTYERLTRLCSRLSRMDLKHAWRDVLPWMAGYALCVAAVIYTAVNTHADALYAWATLGFVTRDVIVVTGFRLRNHGRGSIVIFYLLAVWLAGPWATRDHAWAAAFRPTEDGSLSLAFAWGEAALALVLFFGTFRKLARATRLDIGAATT